MFRDGCAQRLEELVRDTRERIVREHCAVSDLLLLADSERAKRREVREDVVEVRLVAAPLLGRQADLACTFESAVFGLETDRDQRIASETRLRVRCAKWCTQLEVIRGNRQLDDKVSAAELELERRRLEAHLLLDSAESRNRREVNVKERQRYDTRASHAQSLLRKIRVIGGSNGRSKSRLVFAKMCVFYNIFADNEPTVDNCNKY